MATAVSEKPALRRYKVLVGLHEDKGKTFGPSSQDGDIVETESPLDRMFNVPGMPPKFQLLSGDEVLDAARQGFESGNTGRLPPSEAEKTYEAMTVTELKQVAAEEEVNLEGASTKAQIIAKLLGK